MDFMPNLFPLPDPLAGSFLDMSVDDYCAYGIRDSGEAWRCCAGHILQVVRCAAGLCVMLGCGMVFLQPSNPFTAGFGLPPRVFVGRSDIRRELSAGLAGGPLDPRFASLLLGERSSGKTALLGLVESAAASQGHIILNTHASTPGLEARIKALAIDAVTDPPGTKPRRRVTSAAVASVSVSWETSDPPPRRDWLEQRNLRAVLSVLADLAAQNKKMVLLTVDELHSVERNECRSLVNDLQILVQRGQRPIAFIGAGLSEMAYTLLRDKKITFLQRCPRHVMPPFGPTNAWRCLRETVRRAGGQIETEALRRASEQAIPSPYHVQLVGAHAWRAAGAPEGAIDSECVDFAISRANDDMTRTVHEPAWHDLSENEQDFVVAMADLAGRATLRRISERLRRRYRTCTDIAERLELSGCVTRQHVRGGVLAPTWLLPSEAIVTLGDSTRRAVGRTRPVGAPDQPPRCGKWMPRAKARCALAKGHAGRCRSKRP